MAVATISSWALVLASTVTGAVVGLVAGRTRRRFAHGRWISMTVVGLCAPWALLAYAIGHGIGRLLPTRRPTPVQQGRQAGWQQAVHLYAALATGQPPPTVFTPDLPAIGTVYMDVPFQYSRYFAMNVTHRPGAMFAIGSPRFVTVAAIGHLVGASIGYARAANLSRRRWQGHRVTRVVVTAAATWCDVGGRWISFDHHAVTDYRLGADQSCVLSFADTVPLRLHGPSAWCHAVLFAYLCYDTPRWQDAPFLQSLRQASQQPVSAPC